MARILVVEPDGPTRAAIQTLLKGAGHEVDTAEHAGIALLRMESQLPDLVLTELYMDGMDGIELIRAIRRRWPGNRVITMTKGARPGATDTIQIAKLLGARAFLDKPLADQHVVQTVDTALAS